MRSLKSVNRGFSNGDTWHDPSRRLTEPLLTPAALSWLLCAPVMGGCVPWDIIYAVSTLIHARHASMGPSAAR